MNKAQSHLNQFIPLCLGFLLSACATTPPTNFYLLEAKSPTYIPTPSTKKHLIGIGPLTIPALLERRQIVTRKENNSIEMAEFHQWAAPLKDNILSVLSKDVAAQHANTIVRPYPWSAYGEVEYRIIIDITRFDSQLGKSANLEASWAIMEETNHTIISNGETKIAQPLTDPSYESVVQAFDKLLVQFSQQLSLALHQLPQK
jgi:uncharacterized lipoprotein YmbA